MTTGKSKGDKRSHVRELWLAIASLAWAYVVISINLQHSVQPLEQHHVQHGDITPPPLEKGENPFALARSQSFGFFDDITDEKWRRLQKIFLDHNDHKYPDKPLTHHPEAASDQARPEIYKNRAKSPGWSSYQAWYQNVNNIQKICGLEICCPPASCLTLPCFFPYCFRTMNRIFRVNLNGESGNQ